MGRNGLCKERRELERLIHQCVGAIAHSSRLAAKLALEAPGGKHPEFEIARTNYSAGSIRLATLRECLAVHEKIHACGDELTTLSTIEASPPMAGPEGSEGVMACVLIAKTKMEHAKQVIREFEFALVRTKDRIAHTRQTIRANDRLIAELSRLVSQPEEQTRE